MRSWKAFVLFASFIFAVTAWMNCLPRQLSRVAVRPSLESARELAKAAALALEQLRGNPAYALVNVERVAPVFDLPLETSPTAPESMRLEGKPGRIVRAADLLPLLEIPTLRSLSLVQMTVDDEVWLFMRQLGLYSLEVEKVNAGMDFSSVMGAHRSLRELVIRDHPTAPLFYAPLSRSKALRALTLVRCRVPDGALEWISRMGLEHFDVREEQNDLGFAFEPHGAPSKLQLLSGDAIGALAEPLRSTITSLRLSGLPLDDSIFSHLRRFPNLAAIDLSATNVSLAGRGCLKGLRIYRLSVAHTKVSAATVGSLAELRWPYSVNLNGCALGDQGVASALSVLPQRRLQLQIAETGITDKSVPAVERMLDEGRADMIVVSTERTTAKGRMQLEQLERRYPGRIYVHSQPR